MKTRTPLFRIDRFLIAALALLAAPQAKAQTTWAYDFGTNTGTYTANAISTNFLPDTPAGGGTDLVRVGTGGGSFTMTNVSGFGSGSALVMSAATGTSVNKFSIFDWSSATTAFTLSFDMRLVGGTNGFWTLYAGNGATFSNANDFASAETFMGLQFGYGTGGSITSSNRTGTTWASLSTGISQSNNYSLSIYGNNSASELTYVKNGITYTNTANAYHVWVGNTLVGTNIAKGALTSGTSIDSFMFVGRSSTGNLATNIVDNFVYANYLISEAIAAALNWAGGSGAWTAGFGGAVTNGATISFSGAGGVATNDVSSPSPLLLSSITFSNSAGSYTNIQNAFTISNGIVNNSANLQVFSNAITLGAAQTFNTASGAMTFAGNVDNGGFRLTVGGASNTVVSGAISGSGGLTKSGAGTATLSGANSYSGGTVVSAGRVIGDTTSLQGVITNNAALTFSQTTNGTFASAIAGSGSMAKLGSGSVTFSSTVAAGTLDVAEGAITAGSAGRFTGTPTVTVSNAATLNLAGNETFGSLAGAGSVSNSAGTLTVGGNNSSTTFSGALSGAGAFTKTGSGTITVSGANTYGGATTIAAGGLTVNAANSLPTGTAVIVGTSGASANGGRFNINAGLTQTISSLTLLAGSTSTNNSGHVSIGSGSTLVVNGGVTYETTNGALFSSIISGGTLDLGGGNQTFLVRDHGNNVSSFGGDLQVSSVISNGGITKTGDGILNLIASNAMAGTVTVSAGTLALSNANALRNATLDTGSSGAQQITFHVAGDTTYNIGALQGADALAIGGNTISVGANNASTIYSGAISGTGGGFTKVGSGTITLSGANSFTGPTAINAGAVRATIAGALGGTATNTVVASGAALELDGGFSLNAEPITISGTGIGNGGAIRNISGANTNTGVITLAANSRINSDAGTLLVNVTGADANAITGSFNLSLGGSGNFDFRDRIAIGTGVLTKDGSGTLTLISAALHSGGTTLSSGTIQLGATENNALGTGTVTLNGGILSGNNTVTRTLTNDVTIGGNLTFGDGSSTAAITLSGPISLGAVNRALTVQNANTTFSGAVSGGGASITKNGSGTLTLSGSNSFTGGATVNGGILRLANTGAAGSGTITQTDGTSQIEIDVAGTITNDMNAYVIDFLQNGNLSGSITMNGTVIDAGSGISATNSGLLIGSGGMTKTGLGTLTLSAGNSYSGATTVSGGRLVVNGSQSSSAVTVNSGASLAGTGTVGALTVSGLLAPGNSIGTLSAGSTIFNTNGTFELEISDFGGVAGTAWDLLAITGDLTLSNTSVNPFAINLVSMTNGTTPGFANFNPNLNYTNTFVTYSGSLLGTTFNTNLFSISTASFSNAITLNGAFSITNVSGGLALLYSTFFVPASDYTWTAGSGLWSDQASWTNNIEPGENGAIVFAGAGGNSTNDLVTSTANLVFSNTAGSYTLSGNAITNGVLGVVNNSANAQTINNDIILGGAQTFDAAAGDLNFGGGIDNAGFLLSVSGASNVVINGAISNTGGITMSGAGSLTLGGNNTFSGTLAANAGTVLVTGTQATAAVNVSGGTLLLGTNNVLSDSTALTFSTGTVNFGGFSDTVSTFNQSGGVFTNGTLTATTYGLSGGTVGGTLGAGTVSVTGSVSLSGEINSTLNINTGGTLTLGSADRIGNSSAVTVNAGTLATVTFSDTVGSLVLTNSGSLTGTGTITAGTYTLNGGTVGANLGAGTATSSASTTTLNGTLDADLAVSGGTVNLGSGDRIGGASAVTVSSGTLGISTFNDTVGSFTITGGTLGGTTGTLTAGTYALQGGTLAANLGAGTATVTTGTTALNGTLGAATVNINSGTLNLGSANRLSDSAAVTLNGGTLGISTLTDTVGSFTIAGGTLGGTSGTLTASTYALNGGTLTANLGAGSVTASSGTTALNGTLAATAVSINGGIVNLGSADRLANTAAITLSSGTLGMSTFNDTVGSLVLSGGTLGGTTGTLTAATYDLQSGTINARLGAGAVTVSNGTTTLGSTGRLNSASALAVNGGELTLGGAETVSTYTQAGGTLGGVGQTLTAASYALQGGTVSASLGSGTATVSSGTTTINGNLGGALTASSGTANLNGTVAGNVTVSGGTVNLGSADRISATSAVAVSSGALNLNGNDSVASVQITGGSIAGSGVLTATSNYDVQGGTISAAIGGSAALTKTGAGTATLSGNSTGYSGAVAVNSGALLATTSGALGTGTVTVTNGSAFAGNGVTLANNFTIGTSSSFSPGTNVLVAGWNFQSGVTGLTGANFPSSGSYAADNGGSGQLTGVHASASTAWSSATGNGSSVALSADRWATGDYFQFQVSSLTLSNINLTWAQTRSGTGATNFTLRYSTNGTSFSTFTNYSVSQLSWNATTTNASSIFAYDLSAITSLDNNSTIYLRLVSEQTSATGGTGRIDDVRVNALSAGISNAATGSGTLGIAEAGTAIFSGAITNNTAATLTAANGGLASFSGAISGAGSVTKTGEGTVTLSANNTYSGGTTISAGTLSIGNGGTAGSITGPITNNAALVFNRSDNLTQSGAISGSGSVTKLGSGTTTLSAANSYDGGTTLSGGALRLTHIAGAGTGTLTQTDGTSTLLVDVAGTIANQMSLYKVAFLQGANLSGNIALNNTTFDVTNNITATNSGILSGSEGVDKIGAGTLVLAGANTYTGATMISNGTVSVSADNNLGTAPGAATAGHLTLDGGKLLATTGFTLNSNRGIALGAGNGTVEVSSGQGLNYAGIIAGAGSLTKAGNGTFTLSGANTYSGGTLVSAGELLGDSTSLIGDITNNATLTFNQVTNGTYAGSVTGSGTLSKEGAATLTVTGANSQTTGGAIIFAGALQIGSGGTTGSFAGAIDNDGEVIFNRSDNVGYSSAITGSGTVTKLGAGSLTLSGASTYTGATTVSAGTLELNNTSGQALSSTASVTVANGATLLISTSNQVNNSASVSLSGGTITRGSGVSEVFGNLNITEASFLDFGTGATGNLTFGTYQNNETPSALITLNNFIPGNSFTFNSTSFTTNNVGSYFSFGTGYVNSSITSSGSTFTITAIPEPSTYLAAAGLLGMMLWPSRKRIIRDAKRILGLRAPMRDRLAAKRI